MSISYHFEAKTIKNQFVGPSNYTRGQKGHKILEIVTKSAKHHKLWAQEYYLTTLVGRINVPARINVPDGIFAQNNKRTGEEINVPP